MVPQILLGMLAAALVPAGVPAGRYPSVASRAHGVRCVSLPVDIRSTGPNSRRISSAIDVNASQEDVWAIITDYDRISEYTPNVLRSRVVPSASAGIRVYQEGAQNIAGFEFRASLTMEMKEVLTDALRRPLPAPRLTFRCLQSEMFSEYTGEFRVEQHGKGTRLSFSVDITPRGPVPVMPLEWRIREDVPVNLRGLKAAAEARRR